MERSLGSVDVAYEVAVLLGESPVWDAETNELWWIDNQRHLLFRGAGSGVVNSVDLESYVGSIALERGSLAVIAAGPNGFARLAPGVRRDIQIEHEQQRPKNRLNDGKCDPRGRMWAGSMGRSATGRRGSCTAWTPTGR